MNDHTDSKFCRPRRSLSGLNNDSRRYLTGLIAAVVLTSVLCGCTTPASRFVDDAGKRNFIIENHQTNGLKHVVIKHRMVKDGQALHVYFDGDGTPVLSRRRIASDPSSRSRLVLELMGRDAAASILVGRPCYYLRQNDCDPVMWTDNRYSEAVVATLAATVREQIKLLPNSPVTLIGYSGGGTLAMLVAPRLPRVERIVTIAANLNVTAWANHHGYSVLNGSLDPAEAAVLADDVEQLHLFGADDQNVPFELMRGVAERGRKSTVLVIPDYDHSCCWLELWPRPLEDRRPETH